MKLMKLEKILKKNNDLDRKSNETWKFWKQNIWIHVQIIFKDPMFGNL